MTKARRDRRPMLTSDLVKSRLAGVEFSFDAPRLPISSSVWPYYVAAAVVPSFTPAALEPVGNAGGTRQEALRSLVLDCVPEDTGDEIAWRLQSDVRKVVLRELGATGISEALAMVGGESDSFSSIIRSLAMGAAPQGLERIEEVQEALLASDWLNVDDSVRHDIRKRLELLELLQPFRELVGDHFGGRRDELEKLAAWVRETSRFTPAALAVIGPGGAGKSTLIARFILDHAKAVAAGDLAFAYLDAERPTILPEDPRSLLMEVARQLAVQFPDAGIDLPELKSKLSEVERHAGRRRVALLRQASVQLLAEKVLSRIGRRFLLVLDTFEEIQYRSTDFVHAIGLFLDDLRKAFPQARTVIGSRAPIKAFKTEAIVLNELDAAAAIGFLTYRGVSDPEIAKAIFAHLGGNPLTLKLAADLAQSDEAQAMTELKGVTTRNLFFLRIDEEVIQGNLYRRILNRITDTEIRKLAHPGLVVRRITPAVIYHILARPCGLKVTSMDEARDFYARLAKEVSLVEREGQALRHRSDVRRVMLRLLATDEPAKVRAIHELAVEYYKKEKGARARAEEIYHRLMLEQSSSEIDARWRPELESYLSGVLEELPTVSRAYMATKLGYEIDDRTRQQAESIIWERAAIVKVQDLLDLGRPEDALNVLRERPERSGATEINTLEVEALRDLGRHAEALAVIERTLPAIQTADQADSFVGLAEMGAAMAMESGEPARGIRLLENASLIARSTANAVTRLRIALELHRLRNLAQGGERPAEEQQLVLLYRNTPRVELLAHPRVVFHAAAVIAEKLPSVLTDAVEIAHETGWSDPRIDELTRFVQKMSRRNATLVAVAEQVSMLHKLSPDSRPRRVQNLLARALAIHFPIGPAALELARILRDAATDLPGEPDPDDRQSASTSGAPRRSSRRKLKK